VAIKGQLLYKFKQLENRDREQTFGSPYPRVLRRCGPRQEAQSLKEDLLLQRCSQQVQGVQQRRIFNGNVRDDQAGPGAATRAKLRTSSSTL